MATCTDAHNDNYSIGKLQEIISLPTVCRKVYAYTRTDSRGKSRTCNGYDRQYREYERVRTQKSDANGYGYGQQNNRLARFT